MNEEGAFAKEHVCEGEILWPIIKFKMCFEKGDMHIVITFESMTINVFKINWILNLNL